MYLATLLLIDCNQEMESKEQAEYFKYNLNVKRIFEIVLNSQLCDVFQQKRISLRSCKYLSFSLLVFESLKTVENVRKVRLQLCAFNFYLFIFISKYV